MASGARESEGWPSGDAGARVLIVDDEPYMCDLLRDLMHDAGHTADVARDSSRALALLASGTVDLMLLDLKLDRSTLSGMEVLRHVVAAYPRIPVIIISGEGTIRSAVKAIQLGAYDFLEKPVKQERIQVTVRNALRGVKMQRERDRLMEVAYEPYRMVGHSEALRRIREQVARAGKSDSKVLISGESGVGKELVARNIHRVSARGAGPFVALNCAALPEELIESELFGHEKGAYTGAHRAYPGRLVQASGGTLFLDEIGDMSLSVQAKVLRVLENRQVLPLGSDAPRPVDVRLVAATNKDLRREVQAGTFREDLFWRLNVLHIRIPPLRERREDIPALAEHFLTRLCRHEGLPYRQLAPEALERLVHHDWPGNIRELRNTMERLVVLSEGNPIGAGDVAQALHAVTPGDHAAPLEPPHPHTPLPGLHEALARFERDYILKALVSNDWKRQETADALRINRTYLWRKMQRHHITEPGPTR